MKHYISALVIILLLSSCESIEREDISQLIISKIDSMSGKEVIEELLIENGGDWEQIARIFNCSLPTLKRIKSEESYLADQALGEMKNFLKSVKITGQRVFKDNDPFYASVGRSFKLTLNKWVWWAIGPFILFIILGLVDEELRFFNFFALILLLLFFCGYSFTYLNNIFNPFIRPEFLDVEKLNPIFETLI